MLRWVDNCLITPTHRNLINVLQTAPTPMVVERNDSSVGCGRAMKATQPSTATVKQDLSDPTLCSVTEPALFLGGLHWLGHHGHQLTESLSRFWVLLDQQTVASVNVLIFNVLYQCDALSFTNFVVPNLEQAIEANAADSFAYPPAIGWILHALRPFHLGSKKLLWIQQPTAAQRMVIPKEALSLCERLSPNKIPLMRSVYDQITNFYSQSVSHNLKERVLLYLTRAVSVNIPEIYKRLTTKTESKNRAQYASYSTPKVWDIMTPVTLEYFQQLRYCENESNFEFALLKLGFAVVALDKYTLPQQVSIVNSADLCLGIQGTGMHNIVFMRENTTALIIADVHHPDKPSTAQLNLDACSRKNINVKYLTGLFKQSEGKPKKSYSLEIDQALLNIKSFLS